jgi:hypothetical protein
MEGDICSGEMGEWRGFGEGVKCFAGEKRRPVSASWPREGGGKQWRGISVAERWGNGGGLVRV